MSNLISRIEYILDKTFSAIDAAYEYHREDIHFQPFEDSRLVFPRYSLQHKNESRRNAEPRISEQELRFVFVEQFNKICNDKHWPYFYSVETPTDKRYVVSKSNEPKVAGKNEGVSGQFDLAIHNAEGKRICKIEFKAGMSSPEKEFAKDFLKLNEEPGEEIGFFIHLLEEDANINTFNRIKTNRLKNKKDVRYVCHVLKGATYSEGSNHWPGFPDKAK